jgi:serine protease AprX
MKSSILAALFASILAFGQTPSAKISSEARLASVEQDTVLVWMFFSDKDASLSKLADPTALVSERSIERRKKTLDAPYVTEGDLPVSERYLARVSEEGAEIRRVTKWFNGCSARVPSARLDAIAALEFVREIRLVGRYRLNLPDEETPASPLAKSADVGSLDYGYALPQLALMNAPDAHAAGYTGSGVVIAAFDAGFNNLGHRCFDSLDVIAAYDFVNDDANVGDEADSGSGNHGTKVLSTIAAYDPGSLIGAAYDASFILAKTENTQSETYREEDNWLAAAEWADSIGTDIITTSLTYREMDAGYTSYTWEDMDGETTIITRAADEAAERGVVVLNSAGNNGADPGHNTLGAPADGDNVLAIGSTTADGTRSGFSSVGPSVDGRIKPDLMAQGSVVYAASTTDSSSYSASYGTSYACPLAAGAVALLLQARPELSRTEVASLLRSTASQSDAPDRFMGWGIIDVMAAIDGDTGAGDPPPTPIDFRLSQNYPNPFNPSTSIRYALPRAAFVELIVYNAPGERTATLVSETKPRGEHVATFDASSLASGAYFARLVADGRSETIKMTLLR